MRKGQGLMETVVALGVIMTGLISVIALTISNLNGQRDAALRYGAINLAREGIDLVRNVRDSNWVTGRSVWDGIPSDVSRNNLKIQFNPGSSDPPAFSESGTASVTQCQDGHFMQGTQGGCVGASASPFTRTVAITPRNCRDTVLGLTNSLCGQVQIPNPIALDVRVTVAWNISQSQKQVTVSEIFYDWR